MSPVLSSNCIITVQRLDLYLLWSFIFVYGFRDILISFSFFIIDARPCSPPWWLSPIFISAMEVDGSFSSWHQTDLTFVECLITILIGVRWYRTPSLIFSNLTSFHVIFFKCELKVPVKIGFVTVYRVMNSFLMASPRRLQEISCCLLRNAWTL